MTSEAAPARNRRLVVTEDSRPVLARGARLRFDETRQRWVLLVPERVIAPDEIAVEILQLCDGMNDVKTIIDTLATRYTAARDEIAGDVVSMLQDLAASGFVVQGRNIGG